MTSFQTTGTRLLFGLEPLSLLHQFSVELSKNRLGSHLAGHLPSGHLVADSATSR